MTRRDLIAQAAVASVSLALPSCRRLGATRDRASLPADGRPTVAGVLLPQGRRLRPDGGYYDATRPGVVAWGSDQGVENAFALATRLGDAFPRTGLWPVLWHHWDEPASYWGHPAPARRIDAARAEIILRREWAEHPPRARWAVPFGATFPGLAEPGARRHRHVDPFGLLEQYQRPFAHWDPTAVRPRLLLVPVSRPADVVAATGLDCGSYYGGVADLAEVSSVLRSWEDRFGAVLVGLGPRIVMVAVAAPPTGLDQALRVAAEHHAFAPRSDPSSLLDVARELLGEQVPYAVSTREVWAFGWDD